MTISPRPTTQSLVEMIFTNRGGASAWYQVADEENAAMRKCLAIGKNNINSLENFVGKVVRVLGLPEPKRIKWKGFWGKKEYFLVLELDRRTWQEKIVSHFENPEKMAKITQYVKGRM